MTEQQQRQVIEELARDIQKTTGYSIRYQPFRGLKKRRCSFRVDCPERRGGRRKEVFGFGAMKVTLGCLRVSTWCSLVRNPNPSLMGGAKRIEGLEYGKPGWRWEICAPGDSAYKGAVFGLSQAAKACCEGDG